MTETSRHFAFLGRRANPFAAGLFFAVLWIVLLELFTNSLDISAKKWDFVFYIDMAENGILGNSHLSAPFAYRPANPVLARLASNVFDVSTETGFRMVAYVGAGAQLFLVFCLALYFRAGTRGAIVVMSVVALQYYNVKFLLFDVFRPDHLAYPLMILACLALFQQRLALCSLIALVGLLVREFLMIPILIVMGLLLVRSVRDRSKRAVGWLVALAASALLAVLLPRLLIPTPIAFYNLDPINGPFSLSMLFDAPSTLKRNQNICFAVLSYALPAMLLIGKERLKIVWVQLEGYRGFLLAYTLLVLLLTVYGGTDIPRFITYLFLPLAIVISAIPKQDLDVREVLFMLVVVAIFNRTFCEIPVAHRGEYLDFYGGHHIRVNAATISRLLAIAASVLAGIAVRRFIRTRSQIPVSPAHRA